MSDLSATKKTRTPVQNFIGAVIILASITGINRQVQEESGGT